MKKQHIPEIGLHNPAEDFSQQCVFTHGRFEDNVRTAPARAGLHRHAFHEIAIFQSGKGTYVADLLSYDIIAPCAVVIPAGTVHQWPDAHHLHGDIMAFDLEFLGVTSRTQGPAAILRPPIPVTIPLTQNLLKKFDPLLETIRNEWFNNCKHRRYILRSCLSILLIELARQHKRLNGPSRTAADRLYADCLDLLEQNWRAYNTPKKLAAALNVSTDHLSTTLRKASGHHTSALIQERIILEAKRQLAHSRLSVSEIAYALGFNDPSYFTRVFRKHTERTPKQFRTDSNHLHGEISDPS